MLNPDASRRDVIKAVLTLLLGVAVLGLFVVALGGFRFWTQADEYLIRFDTARNLTVGKPVRLAGLQVGRVESIELDLSDRDSQGQIKVVIGVYQHLVLHQNTTARIAQRGIVGEDHVLLEQFGPPGAILPPGSTIPSTTSPDLQDVVTSAGRILQDLEPKLSAVATSLEQLASQDNTRRLERILASLEELTGPENRDNLAQSLARTHTLLAKAEQTLEETSEEWRKLARQANTTLTTGQKTLNKTEARLSASLENLDKRLESTSTELTTLIQGLQSLTGRVDQAVASDQERITTILADLERTATNLRALAETLRERPWLLLRAPEGDL